MKIIDTNEKNIQYYSEAIENASESSSLDFFKWFNGGKDINEIISSGFKTFYSEILFGCFFQNTREKSKELTALEIGCGGGRIINPACKYFKFVYGVDIHNNLKLVENYLIENNITNFELHKLTKSDFPIKDKTIDFVYSSIVFQHILKKDIFIQYFDEIKRVMKKDGLAVIGVGRPRFFSKFMTNNNLILRVLSYIDKLFYETYLNWFKGGFMEIHNAVVNDVNLVVTKSMVKKILHKHGFKLIHICPSQRFNKNDMNYQFGTQYYIYFQNI